jgi:UDP-GlcNAc:undecaprenyl-phosphate/decaprenyl-phosphate GlcNAc-1-phosphate transferase
MIDFHFELLVTSCVSLIACAVLILFLTPVARRHGLVDEPSFRKQHKNSVPLVGGISIFGALIVALLSSHISLSEYRVFFLALFILMTTGLLDDYNEIDAKKKFLLQIGVALILVFLDEVVIRNLGEVFFYAKPYGLGPFAIPFSIVAIVGVINAINMSDGHDGLASGYFVLAALAMIVLQLLNGGAGVNEILVVSAVAVLSFLVFNFSEIVGSKRQVFLGDAGSTALGFVLVFFLINFSKTEAAILKVSAAPWIIGLPLMDMMAVLIFRLKKGLSPLQADRLHIHHLLIELGFSKYQVLGMLMLMQFVFTVVGVAGTIWAWNDGVLLWSCFVVLAIYVVVASQMRARITKRLDVVKL